MKKFLFLVLLLPITVQAFNYLDALNKLRDGYIIIRKDSLYNKITKDFIQSIVKESTNYNISENAIDSTLLILDRFIYEKDSISFVCGN